MEMGFLETAITVLLICSVLWYVKLIHEWWYLRRFGNKKNDGTKAPPGSMGWPVIGEMLDFLWCFKFTSNPDNFIAKRKARYGDTGIYRTYLFGYPTIVTCSPEINKYVLGSGSEEGSFCSGWPSTKLMGVSSVAAVDGLKHKRIRRYLMEAFNSPRGLKILIATSQPIFMAAFDDWVSKRKIFAFEETKSVTFENICDLLVSFKSKNLLTTMEELYRGLMAGIRAVTLNIPGTAYHHALKCRKKLSNILLDEVKERKEKGSQKQDFMQILLDSVDENGEKMSEMEIVDNVVSLILGGYESTSNVMTWGLYYLAKYPIALKKLKEEILWIRKEKSENELLTVEDVKAMKYTSKVADELIRLANVSPFTFRRATKDDIVINGYKIPKDWKVIVWIRSNHIDQAYFQDPYSFNPDRWDDFKPKVGTYNVFGGHGPRYCPGNNFARFQIMLFLHQACLKYRWELLNPDAGIKFLPHPKPNDGGEMYFSLA